MADDYQYEEEYTMEQHYEQDSELSAQEIDPATMVVDIQTPMGPIVVDMKQLEDAKNAVAATRAKPGMYRTVTSGMIVDGLMDVSNDNDYNDLSVEVEGTRYALKLEKYPLHDPTSKLIRS